MQDVAGTKAGRAKPPKTTGPAWREEGALGAPDQLTYGEENLNVAIRWSAENVVGDPRTAAENGEVFPTLSAYQGPTLRRNLAVESNLNKTGTKEMEGEGPDRSWGRDRVGHVDTTCKK